MYFNYGSRKEQIHFARLRLQCSPLKDHLFKKNLIDSAMCSCGRVETSLHYFFSCPKYDIIRRETIRNLPFNDLQSILYGNNLLPDEENKQIFRKVSEFIHRTKRFNNVNM